MTGYKRNRGSEKKRGEMSICEGRGKEKTNNGNGVEFIKCQPFLAQLTNYVAVFFLLRSTIVAKVSLYLPECSRL